jgi:glycosyltransferase involved in cell wall biosynthesis
MLSVAIDSLLRQSYGRFTLHISDNASTDNTQEICESIAARDERVVYTRHPRNLGVGGYGNFRFVLHQATTPFFMWAAHDDRWSADFVEKNLAALKANPEACASISQVIFHHNDVFDRISNSTYPLCGTTEENLRLFWTDPSDCSRFYAIYRTEALRRCVPDIIPFYAADWMVVTLVLRIGHYLEVPEVLMWRASAEPDRYVRQISRNNPSLVSQLFPLLPLSIYLFKHLGWNEFAAIFGSLRRRNIIKHHEYLSYRYPHLRKLEIRVYRLSGLLLLKRLLQLVGQLSLGKP